MKIKIINIYDKDYTCSKCQKTVNYGQVAKDDGTIVTKDKKEPNGKYGKESNVLSAAVDKGTTNLHPCYGNLVVRDFDELTGELKPNEPVKQLQIQGMSQVTETNLNTFQKEVECAYVKLHSLATRLAPEGAISKEIHISTMGLMHDYFSWLNAEAIKLAHDVE